jgi:hypothetical protein
MNRFADLIATIFHIFQELMQTRGNNILSPDEVQIAIKSANFSFCLVGRSDFGIATDSS